MKRFVTGDMPALSLLFVTILTLAVACASPVTQPTATPTATARPAAPTSTASPVPTATESPAATATSVPPAATATELPATATTPPTVAPAQTAQYRLTFAATWSAQTHPLDFPRNAHWSGLIGATHNASARLWEEGALASPGIKSMAETGSKRPLDREIDALIDAGGACVQISGDGIAVSPGTVTVDFTASLDCPLVSVVTMIAPSPDWFVGVSALSLLENGQWVDTRVVELPPYDAGTDSGESYAARNVPTANPETIYAITVEPLLINGTVPSLGTFTFTRLDP